MTAAPTDTRAFLSPNRAHLYLKDRGVHVSAATLRAWVKSGALRAGKLPNGRPVISTDVLDAITEESVSETPRSDTNRPA